MAERPMLFSAPMVRATLVDAKTQTRRVADFPPDTAAVRWVEQRETMPRGAYTGWAVQCGAPLLLPRNCPYGVPGERLWVRETFFVNHIDHVRGPLPKKRPDAELLYRADGDFDAHFEQVDSPEMAVWRPSIHMPRWASRLALEVTEVRVERVQGISRDDAIAEGCPSTVGYRVDGGPEHWFKCLWQSINGAESWDANPFVWVVSFKRLEQARGGSDG